MRLGEAQTFASPEEALEHFGTKGMKWGVRKQREPKPQLTGYVKKPIVRTTKNGDVFTMTPHPPNKFIKAMSKISKKYTESYNNAASLEIKDKDGKKIGHAAFWLQGKDDMYLNWITIEKSARGQGYATAVLQAAQEHGKTLGKKRMLLEVPNNAPDARHIYEQMGFKFVGEKGNKGDMWDGLVEMEYKFDED